MVKLNVLVWILVIFVHGAEGENTVTVTSPVGTIQGAYETVNRLGWNYTYTQFLGIPFAESTTGSRRFSKPVKKAPFSSTFIANESRSACPTLWNRYIGTDSVGEDCLNLDVFVPGHVTTTYARAVIIWIYGGAFQAGSKDMYNATSLVGMNDVILVTINYRIGAFGFLANGKNLKGNYGLWDQHMAIRWVNENIAAFGGDPGRVTLVGQSAGAGSVIYQAIYPGNKGLFARVIAESGSANSFFAIDYQPQVTYNHFMNRSSCQNVSAQSVIDCLRGLDLNDIIHTHAGDMGEILPVTDGEFITVPPQELFTSLIGKLRPSSLQLFGDIDVMIGFNSQEGVAFTSLMGNTTNFYEGFSEGEFHQYVSVPFEFYNVQSTNLSDMVLAFQYTDWSDPDNKLKRMHLAFDVVSDMYFRAAAMQTATLHATLNGTANTFSYMFDHIPGYSHSPGWMNGANHGSELGFVLGFPYHLLAGVFNVTPSVSSISREEIQLSASMMRYWANFAKTGNPTIGDGKQQTWPNFNSETQESLVFRTNVASYPIVDHLRAPFVQFWNYLFPALQHACSN